MTNDEKGNVLVSKSSTQLRGCDESDSADRNMQAIEWSVNSDGGEISHKALESAKEFYRDVKDCIGDSPNLSSLASASGWLDCCQSVPDSVKASIAAIEETSEALKTAYQDLQPKLFDAARAFTKTWLESFDFMPKVDLSGIKAALLPFHRRTKLLNVLERSNWPLYLADNNDLFCELEGLDIERTDLDSAVYEIARIHLDERWLASVADRWSEHDELPDGKRAMLKRAIDFHIGRQYDACVSILMCMVEGIIVEYFGPSFEYSSEEEAALFDDFAVEHNLNPLGERKSTKLKTPKDLVLAMSLQTDKGWHIWQLISGYVIDVLLTNNYDEAIAAHNPLKNKICHGVQTNYGTEEHSLKAILVIDLITRLGCAAQQGMRLKAEASESGGRKAEASEAYHG